MINERRFVGDWQVTQKKGQLSYIIKHVLTIGLLLLIVLVLKDFFAHSLDFTWEEVINKVFKNIFIAVIISVIIGAVKWLKNDKKYQEFKAREAGRQDLQTRKMRNNF